MRVLLISPVQALDPPGGDVTYTDLLLADPPAGVDYVTYEHALRSGSLIEHGRWSTIKEGVNLFLEFPLWFFLRATNWARRQRLLFWEPFRFYSVKPHVYDLVHLHMFGVRFLKLDCPIVVSNSISHHYLYQDARHFSRLKLAILEGIERTLCALTGLMHPSYRLAGADGVIAFTEFMKNWYVENSLFPGAAVEVIPPYLPAATSARKLCAQRKIGFVARDFDVKGGPKVLEAFEWVRLVYPDCILHIVGSESRISADEAARRNIIWEPAVDRQTLLDVILPSMTVFAYPTNFDGLPMILLDVMSLGIPAVCSNYPPIREMIEHEVSGLICSANDARELADKIIELMDPAVNDRYSASVLDRFNKMFAANSVKAHLSQAYSRAVHGGASV